MRQGIEDIEGFLKKKEPGLQVPHGKDSSPLRSYQRRGMDGCASLLPRRTAPGDHAGPLSFRVEIIPGNSLDRGNPRLGYTNCPSGRSHSSPRIPLSFIRHTSFRWRSLQPETLPNTFRSWGSRPSGETLPAKRKVIRSAGLLLRQFHRSGFFHADLQLKNFLVSGDTLFLIDFDRSYRKEKLSTSEVLKNLLRLNRSAEKWIRRGLGITRADRLRFLLAYAGDDKTIREEVKRALRYNSLRSLFHRMIWSVGK